MKQNKADYLKQGKRTFLIRITRVQNEIELWNGIRNDGQSEMNPASTFFHSNFGTSFAFSIPLLSPSVPIPIPFFFTVKNGHAAGKCENSHFETRIGIYFRGDVNILLFFPSPPPLILFGFVRYAWFAIRFSQKFCMGRCCKIKSYISVCSCKKDSN